MSNYIGDIIPIINLQKNVLIFGRGGTGKTYLLRELAVELKKQGYCLACTATTGIAAISLQNHEEGIISRTLHSWGGVGFCQGSAEELTKNIIKYSKVRQRWCDIEVLIIDEISMMGADFFDKLDYIAKHVRGNSKPFGGITLVLCGDFLQLPPVNDRWIFESESYKELSLNIIELNVPYRYKDEKYFSILTRVRRGKPNDNDIAILQSRVDAYEKWLKKNQGKTDIIKPTILFSRKIDVNTYNMKELDKLPGKAWVSKAYDFYEGKKGAPKASIKDYKRNLDDMIDEVITLKIGAQVMLRVNLDTENALVNGSRGVIINMETIVEGDFDDENETETAFKKLLLKQLAQSGRNEPIMKVTVKFKHCEIAIPISNFRFDDDKGKAIRCQIPLILAWATTIHKCQGLTLDSCLADLGESVFIHAQSYTALSRVRDLESLFLSRLHPPCITADPKALEYNDMLKKKYREDLIKSMSIEEKNTVFVFDDSNV